MWFIVNFLTHLQFLHIKNKIKRCMCEWKKSLKFYTGIKFSNVTWYFKKMISLVCFKISWLLQVNIIPIRLKQRTKLDSHFYSISSLEAHEAISCFSLKCYYRNFLHLFFIQHKFLAFPLLLGQIITPQSMVRWFL